MHNPVRTPKEPYAIREEDPTFDANYEDGWLTRPLLTSLPGDPWSPVKETFGAPGPRLLPRLLVLLARLRRKSVLLVFLALVLLGCVPLFTFRKLDKVSLVRGDISSCLAESVTQETAQQYSFNDTKSGKVSLPVHLRPETYIRGENTTMHFRDSLRNDTGYMTSFLSAGWTNDQITIGNLIYLARISGRIPIVPPFTSDIKGVAAPLAFSETFDIPRMISAMNWPILEWRNVKDFEQRSTGESQPDTSPDEIGCWNIWEVDNVPATAPRESYTPVLLKLDISYTRAPASVKLIPGFEHDSHSTFWSLAKLVFPEARTQALANPQDNPTLPTAHSGALLPPDQQVVCYDYLYYVCAIDPFEIERDYSPMWRDVMIHAHWNRATVDLAEIYLRKAFSLSQHEAIPPFIAIHARRGDFLGWCDSVPKDDCFAPLSAYARRVREVQTELLAQHDLNVTHVIMTGNERDAAWWDGVGAQGWSRIPVGREGEEYGNWLPVIVDAVVQSMAMGFVGTDRSTFSHMARRRVEDWNGGVTRMVKWGWIGADDH